MKSFAPVVAFLVFMLAPSFHAISADDLARWQHHAQNVTVIRDSWGIAHVYGKTDAQTVFGLFYAQAEDDFNRVEMNYVNAMGRLAEIEGEKELYRDLRRSSSSTPSSSAPSTPPAPYGSAPSWTPSPTA